MLKFIQLKELIAAKLCRMLQKLVIFVNNSSHFTNHTKKTPQVIEFKQLNSTAWRVIKLLTDAVSALSRHAIGFALQFIQGTQIGSGRGDDDVGIGTRAIDHTAAVLQPHRDFALAFC